MPSKRLNLKELRCLCAVSTLVAKASGQPEPLLEAALPLIAQGFERQETVRTRIVSEGRSFVQPGFQESAPSLSSGIVSAGGAVGALTVCRLEERLQTEEGLFLNEERLLLDLIAGQLGEGLSRMRAERTLRGSERLYRRVIETTHEGFSEIDPSGRIVSSNARLEEIFGYAPGEMLGLSVIEDLPFPEDRDAMREQIRSRREGRRRSYEQRFRAKDGRPVWLIVTGMPILGEDGTMTGSFAMMSDITEHKLAEDALRASEARYRRFIETTHEGFAEIDRSGSLVAVNPRMNELFGYGPGEMLGLHAVRDLLLPEDQPALRAQLVTRFKGQASSFEMRFKRNDGSPVWISVTGTPIKDAAGAVTGSFAMMTDITPRKQTERILQESEEKFRALFEANLDGILVADAASKSFVFANLAICRMLGYSAQELTALRVDRIHPAQDLPNVLNAFRAQAAGESRFGKDTPCQRKDGTVFLADITTAPVVIQGRKMLMGVFRDTTERKQAEANLINLQKLESLGALAGGIAHDFNNILTSVLGNISLLEAQHGLEPGAKELLGTAQQACRTGKALSNQLLTFSKGGAPHLSVFDLRPALQQTADFSSRGSGVRVRYDIAPAPQAVKADKAQVAQVIQNLVLNAAQAMSQSGEIAVGTATVELGAGELPPLTAGRYVKVTVQDQGCGIPAEHLSKVFDPYFTTKAKGRGLGLSVCHSIMLKHAGTITVASTPGRGTLLTLFFPAADAADLPAEPSARPITQGSGRVLIMDDEPLVAMTLKFMLKKLGYSSESVADGAAAIEAYRKARADGEPYAAAILDLTVPGGMGGKETVERLRALDPGTKGIVSSGYSNDEVFSKWGEHGFAAALSKPYDLAEVSAALRQALGPG